MSKDLKEHEDINLHIKKHTLVHILFAILVTAVITAIKKMSESEHMKLSIWGFAIFIFVIIILHCILTKLWDEV